MPHLSVEKEAGQFKCVPPKNSPAVSVLAAFSLHSLNEKRRELAALQTLRDFSRNPETQQTCIIMLCAHAEKLIPLFAGDDLPPREANAIRLHLESCANCRRLAAEFAESLDWLREFDEPQFDEPALGGMRDSVLRNIDRIENRSRRLPWMVPGWNPRFAFATSLALLLCAALFILTVNRRQTPRDQESSRAERAPDKTADGQVNNNKRIAIDKPVRRKSRRKPVRPAPEESPQTEAGGIEPDLMAQNMTDEPDVDQSDAPDPEPNRNMLRIEIQTADPNIRIIWFAPKSDAAPNTK